MPASLPSPPRLLDRVRHACRVRHFSIRTEDAYHDWAERFIRFHGIRHPETMSEPEVNAFLTHLAVERNVSASTQNQALAALLFLYEHVLNRPLDRIEGVIRANRPKRLPVVLTRDEVRRVLAELDGTYRLMGELMYGSGLHLLECLRLRVKDLDFEQGEITVREGKGDKDRRTMFPRCSGNRCRLIWTAWPCCIVRTWTQGTAGSTYRRPWTGNCPRPQGNSGGNTFSHRRRCLLILAAASSVGIMPMKRRFRKR